MKYNFSGLMVGLCCLILISGCESDPIIPTYGPPSSNKDKKMIIEEFTGVQCVNCPAGSEEIANLEVLYPGQIIPISIHSGFFATPTAANKYDFRTPEGDFIYSYIGPPAFYPSASFSRKAFTGSDLIYNVESWAANVQQILNESVKVGMNLDISYDPASRKLTSTITGVGNQNINQPLKIHLVITESKIIDWQKYPNSTGHIDEYVHKHVLRKLITANTGDDLVNSLAVSQDFSKTYDFVLPDNWISKNCEMVAYISYANTKEVLQADAKDIEE